MPVVFLCAEARCLIACVTLHTVLHHFAIVADGYSYRRLMRDKLYVALQGALYAGYAVRFAALFVVCHYAFNIYFDHRCVPTGMSGWGSW